MITVGPAQEARLLRALERIRDSGYQPTYNGRPSCPFCQAFVDEEEFHSSDCILLALPGGARAQRIRQGLCVIEERACVTHGKAADFDHYLATRPAHNELGFAEND